MLLSDILYSSMRVVDTRLGKNNAYNACNIYQLFFLHLIYSKLTGVEVYYK